MARTGDLIEQAETPASLVLLRGIDLFSALGANQHYIAIVYYPSISSQGEFYACNVYSQMLAFERMVKLSDRESAIARLCAQGKTATEIAREAECSKNTVKATLRTVFMKCGISGQGASTKLMLRRNELLGMPVFKGK